MQDHAGRSRDARKSLKVEASPASRRKQCVPHACERAEKHKYENIVLSSVYTARERLHTRPPRSVELFVALASPSVVLAYLTTITMSCLSVPVVRSREEQTTLSKPSYTSIPAVSGKRQGDIPLPPHPRNIYALH